MKHFKALVILLMLNLCVNQLGLSQNRGQDSTGDVRKDKAAKRSFLDQILKGLADSLGKKTVVPTEKNARIAYEFKQARIYPSSDALDIIYILNPWLDNVQDIPAGTNVTMPVFPWISGNQRKKLKEEFRSGSKPDSRASDRFDSLANIFNENIKAFEVRYNSFIQDGNSDNSIDPASFIDTLNLFTSNLLPALKAKVPGICKSKMEYFNDNLSDIVENLSSGDVNDSKAFIILNTIRDFFTTSGLNNYSAYSPLQTGKSLSYFHTVSYNTTIVNDNEDSLDELDNSVENKALKCKVYIYDEQGNVIRGRFRVYFAPYVTIYNLENCKDVVQCLLNKTGTKDAGPGSTAAANIANNSNWAIYCTDTQNNTTYLVNEKYNYQNIVDKDENDNTSFKILILYHGN